MLENELTTFWFKNFENGSDPCPCPWPARAHGREGRLWYHL